MATQFTMLDQWLLELNDIRKALELYNWEGLEGLAERVAEIVNQMETISPNQEA